MSKAEAIAVARAVETLLIRENHRFMAEIAKRLSPGYLLRAAEYLLECSGPVYIVTGFPVNDTFETDAPQGPLRSIACAKNGAPTRHHHRYRYRRGAAGSIRLQIDCGQEFRTVSKTAEALYREAPPGW